MVPRFEKEGVEDSGAANAVFTSKEEDGWEGLGWEDDDMRYLK